MDNPILPAHFDIIPLLEQISAGVSEMAIPRQVTLQAYFPPAPVMVCMDKKELEQVLFGLLSNFIQLVQKNSIISLYVLGVDGKCIVEFINKSTPIGIGTLHDYFMDTEDVFHTGLARVKQLVEDTGEFVYSSSDAEGNYFRMKFNS